ncbi:hypothetical protein F4808DRAFT_430170 [Astrocystis sublimbata]|nr:hypothetical protein F4808DRAFT_430170 [Astrocystis sublimbata]
MVGVPGRSKGCSTCRKRKKGCDRLRPKCTQCSTAGLECSGYQRDTVFINHTQLTKSAPLPVVYRREPLPIPGHPLRVIGDVVLPNGLAQTAYTEKYISMFLIKYLPGGRLVPTDGLGPYRDWIDIAHGLYTSDKAIQFSLLSLGLFAAGESQHAIKSYGLALNNLRTTLSLPEKSQNDSLLATCQLMSLLEVFHGFDENVSLQGHKWRSHLNGLLALIRARSPSAYQSGVSHQLFADGRYLLLMAVIKERRRFPLNTPEWRTVPWEKEPKSRIDKLHDIMADASELLADVDQMRYCNDPLQKTELYVAVLVTCQNLEETLQCWLREGGALMAFQDSNGVTINSTSPSDIHLAHMTLLYWTMCAILYSTLVSIHDPPLSKVPAKIDAAPYLRNVANALPYFWNNDAGMCGANLAAWPWGVCLQIAFGSPERYPEEIALLEPFSLQKNGAMTVIQFLNSLQRTTAGPEMIHIEGKEGIMLRAQEWMMGRR